MAYQDVDPNNVLCRIRNEKTKRKLEIHCELQQPNKKRITAPRPNTKAKKRRCVDSLHPSLMTCETIYNPNVKMSTHQDTGVVDHVFNMTVDQDTGL